MAGPDLVTVLVYAQHRDLAVEVVLHEGGRLREAVGVAEVKPERGWVEFYVADPFGADVLMRLPLDAVARVDLTDHEWAAGPVPACP